MKKNVFYLLFCFATPLFSMEASENLEKKMNAIRSMTASFNQVVKAQAREISHSKGTMALNRPGRFRWQTKSPMSQLVIADGQHFWVYDAELEQVTVKKQGKELGSTAGLFLSGYNETVAKDFDVKQTHQGTQDEFDLRAKSSKANFQRVRLSFDEDALIAINLYDQLGQQTSVRLSKVKLNPVLAPSLFTFIPPKDADIVEQ